MRKSASAEKLRRGPRRTFRVDNDELSELSSCLLTIPGRFRILNFLPFIAEVPLLVGRYETTDALAQAHYHLLTARVSSEDVYSFTSEFGEGRVRSAEKREEEGEVGERVEEERRLREEE